jgi:hypothetical protein
LQQQSQKFNQPVSKHMRLSSALLTLTCALGLNSAPVSAQAFVAPENITLAFMGPFRHTAPGGSAGILGRTWWSAFRFAVERINNDPTLLPNTKLLFNSYDSYGDPGRASLNTIRATEDGCTSIVGGYHSACSMNVARMAQVMQMPEVSFGSTSPDLSRKAIYPYFFRVVASDAWAAEGLVKFIIGVGWKHIGTMSSDNSYASGGIARVQDSANKAGLTVVRAVQFPYKSKTLDPIKQQLRQLAAKNIKVVVLYAAVADATNVFKAAFDDGFVGANAFTWLGPSSVLGAYSSMVANSSLFEGVAKGFIGMMPTMGSGSSLSTVLDEWEALPGCPADELGCDYPKDDGTPGDLSKYTGGGRRDMPVYTTYVMDAVYAYAQAFHNIIEVQKKPMCHRMADNPCVTVSSTTNFVRNKTCEANTPCTNLLFNTLKNIESLNKAGIASDKFMFDENQDGRPPFDVVNWKNRIAGGSGSTIARMDAVGVFTPTISQLVATNSIMFNDGTSVIPVDKAVVINKFEEIDSTSVLLWSAIVVCVVIPAIYFVGKRHFKHAAAKIAEVFLKQMTMLFLSLFSELADIITDTLTCYNVVNNPQASNLHAFYLFFVVMAVVASAIGVYLRFKLASHVFSDGGKVGPASGTNSTVLLESQLKILERDIKNIMIILFVGMCEDVPMLVLNCVYMVQQDDMSMLILVSTFINFIMLGYKGSQLELFKQTRENHRDLHALLVAARAIITGESGDKTDDAADAEAIKKSGGSPIMSMFLEAFVAEIRGNRRKSSSDMQALITENNVLKKTGSIYVVPGKQQL